MQVFHNLYQVGGDLNGLTWAGVDAGFDDANCYALDVNGNLILFDCGCGDTLPQIFDNMRYWGLNPAAIKCCLITHSHLDHAGAARQLQDRGVRIIAHEHAAAAMATGDERCCGFLYHKTFIPCQADQTVRDGDRLALFGVDIDVLHLPGHSMGCTGYAFTHEGKRIIVSGDVIGTLLCGDFGWSGSIDFNKLVYLETLKRFARIDFDVMLPGHGLIYFHQPRRRIEQVLNQALMLWR